MPMSNRDFITDYLKHTSGTEVPSVFNRWSCITGLGAWARQDIWLPYINGRLFPNVYTLIIGSAGARKSTAIKGMKRLLERAGYGYFASDTTSREAFLQDLMDRSQGSLDNFEDALFATLGDNREEATPICIAADEFNDFFGNNMLEFLSMLGSLWDYQGEYTTRAKSGNVIISNPNVSILSGNTVDTLCRTFPIEALGQGFFSRQLFIYGEPNGIKIAFPTLPDEAEVEELVESLKEMRTIMTGELTMTSEAKKALKHIYINFKGLDDERFASYESRRFIHLLKLCMIQAISNYSNTIDITHVVRANTVLTAAEFDMPKALGEYGISRNSAVTHKVMKILNSAYIPIKFNTLLSQLSGDVDDIRDLTKILMVLVESKRAQFVEGSTADEAGYLPVRKIREEIDSPLFDWDYLSEEERDGHFR